ncbi:hypothetical protein CIB84_007258 [Bambusicola thoracicus]|uniref:39S ribosomal protein L22, mitochondrial n=1 Tax=Bambusicola thoracicus TaxID=9083 RepID=A0A2P4SXZ9_BAMTH|nr:hypothetical protein CIB84_007258 [Bambusicola thoracicus]
MLRKMEKGIIKAVNFSVAIMKKSTAESLAGKGHYTKRIRFHGKGMFGIMKIVKCHYFVKLVEGPPPLPEPRKTGFDQAKEYVQQLRSRTLVHTL